MPQINVNLESNSYPVIISDKTSQLRMELKKNIKNGRLFIFYDQNFYVLHKSSITKELKNYSNVMELVLESGEKIKSEKYLKKLYNYLLSEKISRSDFILACGGGVTSDLIGYLAATTLRGVRWGIVSTTLLSMVDASIGGKTGINHQAGKNLIGAFHQPSFVFSNINYLQTLPVKELFCGLGEVLKYAGLVGEPIIGIVNLMIKNNSIYDKKILTKLIIESAKYKAEIVSRDEREGNLRMFLNLGHTFGHAIEKTLKYKKLFHGEAVIIGLIGMIELSGRIKPNSQKHLESYMNLLVKLLPNLPKIKLNANEIYEAIKIDKKRDGKDLNFILLNKFGKPYIQKGIDKRQIKNSISVMLDIYRKQGG
ncbi:MAG: 3-dehydroquinate synthase [candidate division Zixibacteria bacterium]|nr:3-dehydroquinate synthase [candidate division Zixibacteria bacterium]